MPKAREWFAIFVLGAWAAPMGAGGGSVTDQAVTLSYGTAHWSGSAEADLTGTEPSPTTDIVVASGWWYRVNGVDQREHAFPPPSSATWSGSRATLVWDDVDGKGFGATEELIALDAERPSGGFISRLTIRNPSPEMLQVTLIHYLDASAGGTPGGDLGTALYPNDPPAPAPVLTFSEGDQIGRYRQTGGATHWALRPFPELRTLLEDDDLDDLDDMDAPFNPGDWTAAFQWEIGLPPAAGGLTVERSAGVVVTSGLPHDYTKGDLLGAGYPGIMLHHAASGLVRAWQLRRTERIGETTFFGLPHPPDPPVAVDDFTGDLVSDLVIRNQTTGAVSFKSGGTSLPLTGAPALPLSWILAATADFNFDGKPDILWRHAISGKLVVWTMNGTQRIGNLIPSPDQAPSANWDLVGARDFNGDGAMDLLWSNRDSGKVAIWYLGATLARISGAFTKPANAVNTSWQLVGAADFGKGPDGVWGTPDLLWRNRISGKLAIWHMNFAGERTSGVFTTPDGPPDAADWTVIALR